MKKEKSLECTSILCQGPVKRKERQREKRRSSGWGTIQFHEAGRFSNLAIVCPDSI